MSKFAYFLFGSFFGGKVRTNTNTNVTLKLTGTVKDRFACEFPPSLLTIKF